MKSTPWSPRELTILRASNGATEAYGRLAAAGFPRTMAAVKSAYRKLRMGAL